jgi:hypothetical protein
MSAARLTTSGVRCRSYAKLIGSGDRGRVAIGAAKCPGPAKRARAAGIDSWDAVEALGEDELERKLYREPPTSPAKPRPRPEPAQIHIELRRTGVTLRLLHEEYLQAHADGYGYTKYVAPSRHRPRPGSINSTGIG